jgi:transposase
VNPPQARRFAQSTGTRAKSDAVDARLLAKMADALDLEPSQLPHKTIESLREILLMRDGLIKEQTAEKNRNQDLQLGPLKRLSAARLARLRKDLDQLDALIAATIQSDGALANRFALLSSIVGIGPISAATLIAHMPELGDISGPKIASLAGLAPIVQQSGTWAGQARIGAGRAVIRKALYMPAISAIRYNKDLKAFYERLRSAGKPHKVAITAVMRKLLTIANSIVTQNRKFRP